jgi:ankyrin repeat protein
MTDKEEHEHRVRERFQKFAESASDEEVVRVWNEMFLRKCAFCGATKSTNLEKPKLQKCSGCFCARYCCVDHQKQHRKEHRTLCKDIAAKHQDLKKTARLNEAWDVAVDFIRSDDIDGFKKVLDEDEELVNWGHDEHSGFNLLRASTELARESFMSILLERGADFNAKGKDGATALMIASQEGHPSCISLLLDRGADVNATGKDGATAIMLASGKGHPSCISLLLDRGADVNAKDNSDDVTALIAASQYGHPSCISLLLDRGADLNAKTNDGYTALMASSQEGHSSCISLLLDRGADVNAKNNKGWTTLMLVSHEGHPSCISLLLDRGADVDAIANDGFTTASSLTKDRQIIRMLTRARADKNNGRSGTNPVLDYDTIDW